MNEIKEGCAPLPHPLLHTGHSNLEVASWFLLANHRVALERLRVSQLTLSHPNWAKDGGEIREEAGWIDWLEGQKETERGVVFRYLFTQLGFVLFGVST